MQITLLPLSRISIYQRYSDEIDSYIVDKRYQEKRIGRKARKLEYSANLKLY